MAGFIFSLVLTALALLGAGQTCLYVLRTYEIRRCGLHEGARDRASFLVAWIRELVATITVLLRCVPRRAPATMQPGGSSPVALIPAWPLAASSLRGIARRLEVGGRETHLISRRGAGGTIDAEAEFLRTELERIAQSGPTGRVDIVAHGTGGLIARALAIAESAAGGSKSTIGNIVTLAAPHDGAPPALLLSGERLIQYRPGSRLLERLGAHTVDVGGSGRRACTSTLGRHVTAIYSNFDAITFPSHAGYFGGAFGIEVSLIGHFGFLTSSTVADLVLENLDHQPDVSQS